MDYLLKSETGDNLYSGEKNLKEWKKVDRFQKEWRNIQESMEKAFNLKTESGRKSHFEKVMGFQAGIVNKQHSLPFDNDYINEVLDDIRGFEKSYTE